MIGEKSENALRTISEVGGALDLKAHVLRFWEGKFSEIQPVKRANGRRYYRPQDVALIAGIKHLLHEQGMTIKGVQKMLKDDAFLAEAKKRSAIITPGTGEELEAILAEQMGASEELIAAMRKAIDTSGAKSVKK